ncbi:Protein NRT1/ PTR FAMILY 7.3 [Dichanthelium oligosanthes]|uniref:Protein NRT1/ PTR FAMILY 7.3 n=1 Tax=Dichanthelium oligosanthes TaxID=888268 RepID=A0A1E5UX07_9POAL|nr:Protein NRT1/ PTR FAMILY 7.3 [Dichanthelium oligosanthes]
MMESPKTSSTPTTPLQGENSRSSPLYNQTENTAPYLYTEDGTVDFRGNPAVRATTGGKRTTAILLVNYALMNLAFGGVAVDLVMFLRRVLHQENAEAANNVSKWTGTVYMFSLFGAFLSDSYMGRYITCIVFQVIYLMGLVLLSVSSLFLLVEPSRCGDGVGLRPCQPPSQLGIVMFYVSIYTTAFGIGGYQPSMATFGADQFDDSDTNERGSKLAFFSYFYLALNIGSLFSNSLLAFYEDRGMWIMGFWGSTVAVALGLLLFLLGTPYYRHFRPTGNPLTRMLQVFAAAFHKRHIQTPPGEDLHEVEDEDSGVRGILKLLHRDQLRCLDKAAIVTKEDCHAGNTKNPWRLCTVTQVEEVKCILSMIPIWICTIIYSVEFTQMASTFVEQGTAMDTNLFGKLRVPAASMSVFDICSVLLSVFAYRFIIVPMASRFTKNPNGITNLQRMGAGLVIAMTGMLAAAVVEVHRRHCAVVIDQPSPMSVLWQAPQYVLIGASEVFMYIGQLDFFNGQMPDGLKSFGSSLCMASISLGNFVSMLMVSAVTAISTRRGRRGWITRNLNHGHLERFFLLLAGLSSFDFIFFVTFAFIYKGPEFKVGGEHISHL